MELTRDLIESMEAGREMDWLILERVFCEELDKWHDHPEPYSTDIACAWKVVEKLENEDWWWEASNVVPNSDEIVYEWQFRPDSRAYYACEFTLPLAICRSALMAKLSKGA